MADFLVHFATAYAGGLTLRDARVRAILYVGVCLPDLLFKTLLYVAGAHTWAAEPTHAPLTLPVYCYAAALLFEESWRKRAFWALLAGSYLHIMVDAGKSYLGLGVIMWGFPFTMSRVEYGLYAADETVTLMGPAAALILLIEITVRIARRRPAKESSPS